MPVNSCVVAHEFAIFIQCSHDRATSYLIVELVLSFLLVRLAQGSTRAAQPSKQAADYQQPHNTRHFIQGEVL